MSIKHEDLLIESGKPFANCKLDRQKYYSILFFKVSRFVVAKKSIFKLEIC